MVGLLAPLGGLAAVGAGWLVWRAWDRGAFTRLIDGPAFQPWRDWDERYQTGPRAAIAAAVLAASTHNSQPWRFHIASEREIRMFGDPDRRLRLLDPYRHEYWISLGCALENLVVAARAQGLGPSVTLLPDTADPEYVARITLSPGQPVASPQAYAIGRRHTNRAAYARERELSAETIASLLDQATTIEPRLDLLVAGEPAAIAFTAMTMEATATIVEDRELIDESCRWFRQTPKLINAHRDGIAVTQGGHRDWTVRLAIALPDFSQRSLAAKWLQTTRTVHCATTPLFGLISLRSGDDPRGLVEAGRLWQRLHLQATTLDVAMQPLSQAMRTADRERFLGRPPATAKQLAGLLQGGEGWQVVFGFRAGYALRAAGTSPRRSVGEVTLETPEPASTRSARNAP